ncbi:MAG: hypothetical protein HUU02_08350 [Bacteroidetes bacterium]|nr:hypothetical protein [Bacteroidota bacterium]
MIIFRIALLAVLLVLPLSAEKYPSQVKKSVTFLFAKDTSGRLTVQGTGFFVLMKADQGPDTATFGYLVTTRTALQRTGGSMLDSVYLRINRKDGSSDTLLVLLRVNGEPRFFPHPDSTVDLVVVPAFPDLNRYDLLYTPASMIVTSEYFARERVTEGTPLFHVGMLEEQLGTFRNIPAVRFGTIVQFSEEKYRWNGMMSEFYVMEPGTSAGSNGAPVFHYVEAAADTSGAPRPARLALCGIIAGPFGNTHSGRSAVRVTPSQKLNELLLSPAVSGERDKEFIRLRTNAGKR